MADSNLKLLDQLRERRPEIHEFITHCIQGSVSPSELDGMKRLIHSIAVDAGLHGYPPVMESALHVDGLIRQGAPLAELAQAASRLADHCNHILNFTAPAPQFKRLRLFNHGADSVQPCLLAADDDRLVREMIKHLFRYETHLLIACDGKEALDLMSVHQPDLVILDDIMPEITGLRLIEMMRVSDELKRIPVIMLTSSNRDEDFKRAFDAGAANYITKPFDPVALSHLVHQKLGLPEPTFHPQSAI